MMNTVYNIQIPEKCSIPAIYRATAVAAGKKPGKVHYDCRHIMVSKDIFDAYEAYMEAIGCKEAIGSEWMIYGPKVNEKLPEATVEIEDGFFTSGKS